LGGFELFGFWLGGFGLFRFWLIAMAYELPLRVTGMDVGHCNEWNRVTTICSDTNLVPTICLGQPHAEYQE